MDGTKRGAVAVIFISRRNGLDDAGYAAASTAMAAEAARQPGYLGIDAVRDAAGEGITISWWADEAAALAWRAHAAHVPIRERGRADWYDRYEVAVATVDRAYAWERTAAPVRSSRSPEETPMPDRPETAEDTTGEAGIAIAPPSPQADVGKPPHMDGTEDEGMVRDTAVQGTPED